MNLITKNKKIIYGILIVVVISAAVIIIINQKITPKPQGTISECENRGGKRTSITECNGEINAICILPNNQICYLENFRNGKCEEMFSPKVLCDNEKNIPD